MYKLGIILFGLIWVGCSSSHKLTGTDYVNIENESAPGVDADYPSAIINEVGWNDITSALNEKKDYEEFRILLKSSIYPAYLFKITKERKKFDGESILYWEKNSSSAFNNAQMTQYLDGTCTEFFETENFGYCFPNLKEKIDWENAYARIEQQNIWQIADQNTSVPPSSEKYWKMYVQVRLGNYYRDYSHESPENYEDGNLSNNVRSLSRAVKHIVDEFEENSTTNMFEGVTDGASFTLCDSSEVWAFEGNLNNLLRRAGLKSNVNIEEEENFYYIVAKGRAGAIWYNDWANSKHDRKLSPNEIYDLRAVREIKCPEK